MEHVFLRIHQFSPLIIVSPNLDHHHHLTSLLSGQTENALHLIVVKTNLTHNFSCMFISILYMFRAAMCPSSGELLYQCDTSFMSLCVDDRLACRFGQICAHHQENYCISATPGLYHSV